MLEAIAIERLRERSIVKLATDAALDHIAVLIDMSLDEQYPRGIDRALNLLQQLNERELTPKQYSLVEYFRANAWSAREEMAGNRGSWDWEHAEREKQILALSRAATHPGFNDLEIDRRCQILTNRANLLHTMGRFVDAIESWDSALRIKPNFAKALGNRGYGLADYGHFLQDEWDRGFILLYAHDSLMAATAGDAYYESGDGVRLRRRFAESAKKCAAAADLDQIHELTSAHTTNMGRSLAERAYRQWCLDNRLFLNPLNDLGTLSLASVDTLVLPTISEAFHERPGAFTPPPVFGFFNHIKQEYASARYMLYEGLNSTKPHFSDRGVLLPDTLDYPAHSMAIERIRTSYRVAYSLLDKVAFFIDHFWKLGKVPDRISFRTVWMTECKTRLLDRFKTHPNWPLRGLYWLSKELFDDELKSATSADARELHDMRNAMEHRYLQVYDAELWNSLSTSPPSTGPGLSVGADLLEAKALRMMKMARSALIQLVLAVGVEEHDKRAAAPEKLIASSTLHNIDDRRKRRGGSW